jgi:hypothetical protein
LNLFPLIGEEINQSGVLSKRVDKGRAMNKGYDSENSSCGLQMVVVAG